MDVSDARVITSKARTTLPRAVRTALGVRPGDEIASVVAVGHVLMTRVTKLRGGVPVEDPFASFREWDTPEDDEALRAGPSGAIPSATS